MKKALIIGGGGFIGSNIARFLLNEREYKVDVIDNFLAVLTENLVFWSSFVILVGCGIQCGLDRLWQL